MNKELLKNHNKIFIDSQKITNEYNYNLLNNILSSLGRYHYTFSLEALDIFCKLEWNYRVKLLAETSQLLYKQSKDSQENLNKFYINYPNEVNSQDKRELYINSLLYYYHNFWRDSDGDPIMDKPELTPDINLSEIDFILDLQEAKNLLANIKDNKNLESQKDEIVTDKEEADKEFIDETIKAIERALEGGREGLDPNDPYTEDEEIEGEDDSEDDLDEDEETEDEDDLDEDDFDDATEEYINPYDDDSDEDEETEDEDDSQITHENNTCLHKNLDINEESKESLNKKFNGRYIDELIDKRKYLELLKLLKREPNELSRRILFIIEGIYFKFEEKDSRLEYLAKSLGVFEALVDSISYDLLEQLYKDTKFKLSFSNLNASLSKPLEELLDIIKEEIENR